MAHPNTSAVGSSSPKNVNSFSALPPNSHQEIPSSARTVNTASSSISRVSQNWQSSFKEDNYMAYPLPTIGPKPVGGSSNKIKSKHKGFKLDPLASPSQSPSSTFSSTSSSTASLTSPSSRGSNSPFASTSPFGRSSPYSSYVTSPNHSSPVRNTLGLPNNFMSLDYVEKLSYCRDVSPYHVTTLAPLSANPQKDFRVTNVDYTSLNCHNIKLISEKKISFGHESYKDMEPEPGHVAAYKLGVEVKSLPMRIATHCLRGVKVSKQPAGNADKNICRPHGGGFYATA